MLTHPLPGTHRRSHFAVPAIRLNLPAGFLAICAWICSAQALAETPVHAHALSLKSALKRTLERNPQLHQYTFREQGLLAQKDSMSLTPAISIGLELENFGGSGEYKGSDAAETSISLSSVLELGSGKRTARVAVAEVKLNILAAQQKALSLDILAQVTAVFIQTLAAQKSMRLSQDALAQSLKAQSIVLSRAQRGAGAEVEVKRAAAAVAEAEIHLDGLNKQFMRRKVQLAALFGQTQLDFSHVHGDLFAFAENVDFSDLYQRAQTAPSIEVFASKARLKNAQLQLARTQSHADLSWEVGVRRFEQEGDSALTAAVSLPLFSGKRNKGAIKSALAARDELEYRRRDAMLSLHARLYDAFSQRQQHIYAVNKFQHSIIPALEQALILTQKAYENGRDRYKDWIDAQSELRNAKQKRIENAAAALLHQAIIEQLIAAPLISSPLTPFTSSPLTLAPVRKLSNKIQNH